MNLVTKVLIAGGLLCSLIACEDDNNFPNTPTLTVREFTKVNSDLAIWKLGFTDGDGDIGVRNDSDPDNFIYTVFSIEDGVPVETPGQSYRIPVVRNIRTARGIEGEFEFRLETDLFRIDTPFIDTAFLRAYVVDRSNNQSNMVETPIFPTN